MNGIFEFFGGLWEQYGALWFVGQFFGIVAIILGFVSYQLKTKKQLLLAQSGVALMFCLHYFFIGAYSGMVVNILNIFRNFIYDRRTEKGIKSRWIPIFFVLLQIVFCILAWDSWYSIFILTGICINTYCMSLENPQTVRKSILVTSPMVLTYDLFAGSLGGSIYESVAIISALVGIFRNKNKKEKQT